MSEIIHDKEGLASVYFLIKEWGVKYLVEKEISGGFYEEHRENFSKLNFDGNNFNSPEDYLTHTLEDYLISDSMGNKDKNCFKLRELLYRLGFVIKYGGSISLDTQDLKLIDDIAEYSEIFEKIILANTSRGYFSAKRGEKYLRRFY